VGGTNCNLFLSPTGAQPISDVTITGNSLQPQTRSGAQTSFGICLTPQVSGVKVTGNRIAATGWQVAPATTGYAWAAWSGNTTSTGTALTRP
jgi:hypothetical protein